MDGTRPHSPPTTSLNTTPGAVRIETGDAGAVLQPAPKSWPAWVAPAGAGGAVFVGVMVALLGVVWLRKRPTRVPSGNELFEQVVKALALTPAQRERALAFATTDGLPSAVGAAVWV